MSIQITQAAHAGVESAHQRTRMPKVAMWERLAEWFGNQDAGVQNLVLGVENAADKAEITRLVLDRMASESAGGAGGLGAVTRPLVGQTGRRTTAQQNPSSKRKRPRGAG